MTTTPSDPAETVEWGLLRDNGTVAGPLWKGEVLDLGPKWGAQIVSRVVTYGDWEPSQLERSYASVTETDGNAPSAGSA